MSSFGTKKQEEMKTGYHNFVIREAKFGASESGAAWFGLGECVVCDETDADFGASIYAQNLSFMYQIKGEPAKGTAIADTFYFLVACCGLDYVDFDSSGMSKIQEKFTAFDRLLDFNFQKQIEADIVDKRFSAEVIIKVNKDKTKELAFSKGSFNPYDPLLGKINTKKTNGSLGKNEKFSIPVNNSAPVSNVVPTRGETETFTTTVLQKPQTTAAPIVMDDDSEF